MRKPKEKRFPTVKSKVREVVLAGTTYFIHLNGLVAYYEHDKLGWLTAREFRELAQRREEHSVP